MDTLIFEDVKQLEQSWMEGKFLYPEEFVVSDIPYHFRSASDFPFIDIIRGDKKAFTVYSTNKDNAERARKVGMDHWLVFIWSVRPDSTLAPAALRPVPPRRFYNRAMFEEQERIGDVAILKVFLPSGVAAIKGKVDTGAEISSLHAEDIKKVGNSVTFFNPSLSQNRISVALADQQAVKSADGGVEYRPVIELDIEINGKAIRGATFNLNNRDQMEYPVLIGQNVLEKTNFLVDPKIDDPAMQESDEPDYNMMNEYFSDVVPRHVGGEHKLTEEKAELVSNIVEVLENTDITLSDIFRYVRTEARSAVDDVEY